MTKEISIRPIEPAYRCFKLEDVTEESLNKLITWANDELGVHIEVSLNTNNKLYVDKNLNNVVANYQKIELSLLQRNTDGDYDHRNEMVVIKDEPIYCVYANPYFELYKYSDFHKEFIEEVK